MYKRLSVFTVLSATLAFSCAAFAAGPGPGPREACRDDAHSFCSDVKPGGGRILDCLKDHYKELSDTCYNALQNMPEHGPGGHGEHPPPPPPAGNNDGPPPPSGGNDDGPPPPRGDNNGPPPPSRGGNGDGPPPDSGPAN